MARIEERLEGCIDGLLVAEKSEAGGAWSVCLHEMQKWEEFGEVFAAGWLALKVNRADWFGSVLEVAAKSRECARGLVSAIGWLPFDDVKECVDALLTSDAPELRRMGIAACAVHRHDSGEFLRQAISDEDAGLRERALRAVGELARRDLLDDVREKLLDENDRCRFSAAWSVARLDYDEQATNVLREVAGDPKKFGERDSGRALQLLLRVIEVDQAVAFAEKLIEVEATARLGVTALGVIGLPAIPRLLELMNALPLSRLAGEAFSMMTGVDLAYQNLEVDWPEGFEAGPNDDPADENVAMDPDENLPWPNRDALSQWWHENKARFDEQTRYLCGQPTDEENCERVLREGFQRQRAAAALELALIRPDQPLFNVAAPAIRQQKQLGF